MLNLSSSNNQRNKLHPEKIDLEMPNRLAKQKLPRHIFCLESKGYQADIATRSSKMCPEFLAKSDRHQQETINLAVYILKYQLNDHASRQKHRENVCYSLKYRLSLAYAKGNRELVNILQAEARQLEATI